MEPSCHFKFWILEALRHSSFYSPSVDSLFFFVTFFVTHKPELPLPKHPHSKWGGIRFLKEL